MSLRNSWGSRRNRIMVDEYVQMRKTSMFELETTELKNPFELVEDDVLAVHYADGGAQGDAGAVEILYCLQDEVQILYGNYVYGKLDLNAVIAKLPMLKCLDSRYNYEYLPYPFGGELSIPEGWNYLYMGAMNHLFVRKEVAERTNYFCRNVISQTGKWEAFNAIAWFYGVRNKSS